MQGVFNVLLEAGSPPAAEYPVRTLQERVRKSGVYSERPDADMVVGDLSSPNHVVEWNDGPTQLEGVGWFQNGMAIRAAWRSTSNFFPHPRHSHSCHASTVSPLMATTGVDMMGVRCPQPSR